MKSIWRRWRITAAVVLVAGLCVAFAPYVLCRCGRSDSPERMPVPSPAEIVSIEFEYPGQKPGELTILSLAQTQEIAEILSRSQLWRCRGWRDFDRRPHLAAISRLRLRHKDGGESLVRLTGTTMVGFDSSTTDANRFSGTWYEIAPEELARVRQVCDDLVK
jgi:hypothetical protein